MALPVKSDLEKMDYSYQGQPFVNVPGKSSIDLTTMDYVYQAQPFVSNPLGEAPPAINTTNFFIFI